MTAPAKSQKATVTVNAEQLYQDLGGVTDRPSIEMACDASWLAERPDLVQAVVENFDARTSAKAKEDVKAIHQQAEDNYNALAAGEPHPELEQPAEEPAKA